MRIGKFGIAAALVAAGLTAPAGALAKPAKGLIKAKFNGKGFKANVVKVVTYTAANQQLTINGAQHKRATMVAFNLVCLGVELSAGNTASCLGAASSLAPLKGQNAIWGIGDSGTSGTVTIKSYDGKTLKATFEASAPANSSTGGAALTISGGVVKAAVAN